MKLRYNHQKPKYKVSEVITTICFHIMYSYECFTNISDKLPVSILCTLIFQKRDTKIEIFNSS